MGPVVLHWGVLVKPLLDRNASHVVVSPPPASNECDGSSARSVKKNKKKKGEKNGECAEQLARKK